MKSVSRSVQRRIAVQKGGPPVAEMPRHEELDLLLRQHAKRLHLGAFELMEVVQEALDGKVHERFGYEDFAPYVENRTGLSYRSICRQLAVLAGLRALPPADLAEAKQVLAELGAHRASILAPALEKEPTDWKDWVEIARDSTEEALQDAVSSALGLKPRGKAGAPGEKLWAFILNQIPPERREQAQWVVKKVMEIGETQNGIAVFLYMVDVMERDLAAQGIYRDGKT